MSTPPRARLEERRCYGCGGAFREWSDRYEPWCVRCRDRNARAAGAPGPPGWMDDAADEAHRIAEWKRDRI